MEQEEVKKTTSMEYGTRKVKKTTPMEQGTIKNKQRRPRRPRHWSREQE
jgi:hypothetical protein